MSATAHSTTGAEALVGHAPDVAGRITALEDLASDLFELAIAKPEHLDTFFRLSDNAKAEAERLRRQLAVGAHAKLTC